MLRVSLYLVFYTDIIISNCLILFHYLPLSFCVTDPQHLFACRIPAFNFLQFILQQTKAGSICVTTRFIKCHLPNWCGDWSKIYRCTVLQPKCEMSNRFWLRIFPLHVVPDWLNTNNAPHFLSLLRCADNRSFSLRARVRLGEKNRRRYHVYKRK